MTPVDQTRFVQLQNNQVVEGDCLVACVATITGIPLAEIPDFCAAKTWYPAFAEWLALRGYAPLSLRFDEPGAISEHLEWTKGIGKAVPWIAGGTTPQGRHFVVYLGDRLFHDPDPNDGRQGLTTIHDATFLLRAAS